MILLFLFLFCGSSIAQSYGGYLGETNAIVVNNPDGVLEMETNSSTSITFLINVPASFSNRATRLYGRANDALNQSETFNVLTNGVIQCGKKWGVVSPSRNFTSSNSITFGVWHYLTCMMNLGSNTYTFIVDGSNFPGFYGNGSGNFTNGTLATTDLPYFGNAVQQAGSPLLGQTPQISYFRFDKPALNISQATILHNGGLIGVAPMVESYWFPYSPGITTTNKTTIKNYANTAYALMCTSAPSNVKFNEGKYTRPFCVNN